MLAGSTSPPPTSRGLSRIGGAGLIGFAVLWLVREILDVATGPPPGPGAQLVPWVTAHRWTLASQSEILFFALMCLIPAVPVLYARLEAASSTATVLACGTLAAVVPLLAMLVVVHGRLAFPVYGLRVETQTLAEFVAAVFYGGLHAVELMLAFAILMLTRAMKRSRFPRSISRLGLAVVIATILTGYPWALPSAALIALHTGVAAWWTAVGWALYRGEDATIMIAVELNQFRR